MPDSKVICNRCGSLLEQGEGAFYVVRIEAFADPTPPRLRPDDLHRDLEGEIERLLDRLAELSPQEAMDQVYRRLVLVLCNPCYAGWIENPVGR